jgi:hypothetical protein
LVLRKKFISFYLIVFLNKIINYIYIYSPFQNCDFDLHQMNQEGFSFVSKEPKHLIRAMLVKTPEKRIKIEEIMANPWIAVN